MHACIYDGQTKQSSVFPPLPGTKRVLIENSRSLSPQKVTSFIHDEQDQIQFLMRMKKAKDIILLHQKRKKPTLAQQQCSEVPRSKTQELHLSENYGPVSNRSNFHGREIGFSKVVYNLGNPHGVVKKLMRKESVVDEKYNDRYLRECRSHFISEKPKNNRKKIYSLKSYSTQETEEVAYQNIFQKNNKKSKRFANNKTTTNKKHRKDHEQKSLGYLDLDNQIISENGSSLIEKLMKCRTSKNIQQEEKLDCSLPRTSFEQDSCQTDKKETNHHSKIDTKSTEKYEKSDDALPVSDKKIKKHKTKLSFNFKKKGKNSSQSHRLSSSNFKVKQKPIPQETNQQKRQEQLKPKSVYISKQLLFKPEIQNKEVISITDEGNRNLIEKIAEVEDSMIIKVFETKIKSPLGSSTNLKQKIKNSFHVNKFQGLETNYKIQGWNMKEVAEEGEFEEEKVE